MSDIKKLSGFPEYLPEEQIVFNRIISIIRSNFELHGFAPLETPAVERKETLTAKGGNEKEIYALSRLHAGEGESSDTEMALHFDLTVPLARYVSVHQNDLTFPFKRYQIQKVWRGERPQSGRFREFYQCDIDVIGREKLSLQNDAELPVVVYKIFKEMEVGDFTIYINNRKFVQGYLQSLDIALNDISTVLHIIDKRDKIGKDRMTEELTDTLDAKKATSIVDFFTVQSDIQKVLDDVIADKSLDAESMLVQGAHELREVLEATVDLGVPPDSISVDLGIVRGLDYYTGTVYETILHDYPELGTVCAGGRYENLAKEFASTALPGVGVSIGISRLMSALFAADKYDMTSQTPAQVLITAMDELYTSDYRAITATLRNAFIPAEMYLEGGKFDKQLKYAHAKGIRFVIIMGEDEKKKDQVLIKDLISGNQESVATAEIVKHLLGQF